MSVYEVHLGSWRPGLSYLELAEELSTRLATGFTHVELLPVAEHPYGGSWGYQVTSYYAPTARFGTPTTSAPSSTGCTGPASASSSTGCRRTSPRTTGPWPASTAPRSTSTPTRSAASSSDWGTYVFDFGRREVRNFLVANALYWLDEFHVDGLRVDAVASMLYLDYSRPSGEWTPNVHGGRENLEAVAFLQEMNATVHKLVTAVSSPSPRSRRRGRASPAAPTSADSGSP